MEYEYEAAHDDELTLRPGDVIKNARRVEEEGWMEGELNGKKGLFPDNFVKVMCKCDCLQLFTLHTVIVLNEAEQSSVLSVLCVSVIHG